MSPDRLSGASCLVTGATGAIGPSLVQALLAEGCAVRALARAAPPAGLLPPLVDVVIADLEDHAALVRAVADVDVVFHLAAKLHVVNPGPELDAEYVRVNVDATRKLVEVARQSGVGRLVFFSTISVYGASHGRLLTEESPLAPETIYASTKRDAEAMVLGARSASGEPFGVVLRLAAVYGARVKGNYRRLLEALARRRFVPVGAGRNRRTLVHEDDVARAAMLVAAGGAAAGQVFNVTSGQIDTLDQIIDAMCRALGRRRPAIALPEAPVRLAARAADAVLRRVGRRAVICAALDKYVEDVAVDGARLRRQLGFVPAVTLDEGWRRTVESLRVRGEL